MSVNCTVKFAFCIDVIIFKLFAFVVIVHVVIYLSKILTINVFQYFCIPVLFYFMLIMWSKLRKKTGVRHMCKKVGCQLQCG